MNDLRVLIAAAGRGTRAGLPYPKTLHPVLGKPILLRLCDLLAAYDNEPTIIVSPDGAEFVRNCLESAGVSAHLVIQPEPLGMGDAVLHFALSPAAQNAEHVLLVWGDIPFIQVETVEGLVATHFEHGNDFTFATREVERAYTRVNRDDQGNVCGVIETREEGAESVSPGERDIGLFIFRPEVLFPILHQDLVGKRGKTTGEHGFLYAIEHLAALGWRVEALQNGTEADLISLNRMSDLEKVGQCRTMKAD